MKYNIGDKVRIKSLDWYNENKDENGIVDINDDYAFYPDRSKYCGKVFTISRVFYNSYFVKEDNENYYWIDEMFEGLAEEETKPEPKFKIGDKVILNPYPCVVTDVKWCESKQDYRYVVRGTDFGKIVYTNDLVFDTEEERRIILKSAFVHENNTKVDMGEVSDGYHTFNELYEYRMLYNAALFNEFAKQGLYDVHKSRKHSDGEYPFGNSNWFIVIAELPTGQISNHYEMKDWDKFQIPEKPLANKWDEHSPKDVADRLTSFNTPKKAYPKTYEECCKVLGIEGGRLMFNNSGITQYERDLYIRMNNLSKLLICRDAYWKIAGDEMGLGKPWEPKLDNNEMIYYIYNVWGKVYESEGLEFENQIFAFPTKEMRDAFKENFDPDIEFCKKLL